MSDELKPCPKCTESMPIVVQLSDTGDSHYIEWEAWRHCGCDFSGTGSTEQEAIDDYNNRPIEDALRTESHELQREWTVIVRDMNNQIAELEQELAEAKRGNLKSRVNDLLAFGCLQEINPDDAKEILDMAFCVFSGDYFTSINWDDIYDPDNTIQEDIVNWLIEQGVEGKS